MSRKSNIEEYIKKSHNKSIKKQNIYNIFGNTKVVIKDPPPDELDLNYVFKKVDKSIPDYLKSNVDLIYVGQFDEFQHRDINAFYKDGALYITNHQDDEDDMIDDIVHEMAHSVEEILGKEVYGDKRVENEFLGKRRKLFYLLKAEGYNVNLERFLNPEYDQGLDMFLYREVGYPSMVNITMGLFTSPYSATSLREYFASGFEQYFLGDRNYLKKLNPSLYNKIQYISNLDF